MCRPPPLTPPEGAHQKTHRPRSNARVDWEWAGWKAECGLNREGENYETATEGNEMCSVLRLKKCTFAMAVDACCCRVDVSIHPSRFQKHFKGKPVLFKLIVYSRVRKDLVNTAIFLQEEAVCALRLVSKMFSRSVCVWRKPTTRKV